MDGFDWKIDISNCQPLMIGGSTDSLCINFNGTISKIASLFHVLCLTPFYLNNYYI